MIRRRFLSLALSCYPAWWQRRYGAEAAAILEQTPPGWGSSVEMLRGAVDAWTHQRPPQAAFARFTDEARDVVVVAQKEARALRHDYVGTEHILLALLVAGEGTAGRALATLGVTPESVRARLCEVLERRGVPSSPGKCSWAHASPDLPKWSMRLTPRTKRGFELSRFAADRLGDAEVDTMHLLLGMLDEGEGVGAMILTEFVEPARVREELARLRAQ